ncbi:ArsC/Spx/MgsR family protein [Henriciella aquimarina]|uniref:ArsC/Spx/MgsR family protein n=1 Tax=Henriciella aquimarina TaxID=545261 RepID=UPI000A07A524|nr:ArsC/Spx/MgsR family protein [Henriciella aquimarina]
MATLTLYGLKNCDTCKKAMNALDKDGHCVTLVDIRAEADLETKVPMWLKALGPDTLVNKRSTTWRNLTTHEKSQVEQGEAEALLIANPTLIKRPVIETGADVYAGWTKDVQAVF